MLMRVLLVAMSLVCGQVFADKLDYMTENFPPYNYLGESGLAEGRNVDILVEMLKVMENGQERADVKVLPWARGYRSAQDHALTNVLFSTTRTEARETLFKWVGPLSIATNAVITMKGNPHGLEIANSSDLGKYTYSAIRDDVGQLRLTESGVPMEKISMVAQFPAMVKMLQKGRVQAYSYNGTVGHHLLTQHGFNPDDFEIVFSQKLGEHFFAFNKNVDDAVVKAHQDALDKVMSDPEFVQKLKDKWGS